MNMVRKEPATAPAAARRLRTSAPWRDDPGTSGVAWLHQVAGQVCGETVHPDEGRNRSADRLLKLAVPLFEPVDIAACEVIGLVDDMVALEPATKGAERLVEIVDLGRA